MRLHNNKNIVLISLFFFLNSIEFKLYDNIVRSSTIVDPERIFQARSEQI